MKTQSTLTMVSVFLPILEYTQYGNCMRPFLESLKKVQSWSLRSSSHANVIGWMRSTAAEDEHEDYPNVLFIFPESFNPFQFSHLEASPAPFIRHTNCVSFVIAKSFNIEAICRVGKYLNPIIEDFTELHYLLHHELKIDDEKLKLAMGLFPKLEELQFRLWQDTSGGWPHTAEMEREKKMTLVKELGTTFPLLIRVVFLDSTILRRRTPEEPWIQYPART
ncbi:hypothetical protein D9613_006702 [Agrocybe pediades]|uniref:Uncharacterized protein n=1 Tax=Agrocybe pediades TaxID=84607 RepID=A0A8H4QGV9_9AGAR|nr:hypothetical protein D9613_006702 [Agrocybe pediades]